MATVQRQNFNIFHNELLDFLLVDGRPGNQRRAAQHFQVDESTISVIVNSDIFQAKLRDRQDAKHEAVVLGIKERITAVVDLGLQRAEQLIKNEQDLKAVGDVTDKLLSKMGYGPKTPLAPPGNTTINQTTIIVNQDDLAGARQRIMEKQRGQVIEQTSPPAQALPDSPESDLGAVQSFASNVLETGESNGREEVGQEV